LIAIGAASEGRTTPEKESYLAWWHLHQHDSYVQEAGIVRSKVLPENVSRATHGRAESPAEAYLILTSRCPRWDNIRSGVIHGAWWYPTVVRLLLTRDRGRCDDGLPKGQGRGNVCLIKRWNLDCGRVEAFQWGIAKTCPSKFLHASMSKCCWLD
jgi:hypothetical protein